MAWSSDGSKLLIQSYEPPKSSVPPRLFVLNADGTETTLATSDAWCSSGSSYCGSGGSFSPDGAQVIYAAPSEDNWRSSIYVVDAQGGTPRVLLAGDPSLLPVERAEQPLLAFQPDVFPRRDPDRLLRPPARQRRLSFG